MTLGLELTSFNGEHSTRMFRLILTYPSAFKQPLLNINFETNVFSRCWHWRGWRR